jgi:Tol biopolymer transport system component
MTRAMRVTAALMLGALLVVPAKPIAQGKADVALRAAMETETVKGDLKGAIEQYKKVVADAGTNRALAAQALVRMANCYQKLGDAEAHKIYEQLVRDYADQNEAVAIARTHLDGGSGATRSAGDRAVWTGRDVDLFGTVSPDGRLLTYVDWLGMNNVMVRDLVAGTNRALTSNTKEGEFGYGQWSAISRDGQQVAYEWVPLDRRDELRVASLRGSGVPAFRRIRQFEAGESVRPFDWSPDGKSIAVLIERTDRSSQIGILSVPDGAIRPLKSIDWRGVSKMVFSPDGRYIAYDLSVGDGRDRTHIYVLAVDASRETAVVEDASRNNVMGWSPDGHLVFVSNRTGTRSLWTMPIEDGRSKEAPRLVKENVGSTWSLGLTPSGTLYIWQRASAIYVRVAPFDFASGKFLNSAPVTFQRFVESRGRPAWSADGRYLLYLSGGEAGGGRCALFVRSSESGLVREIPHALGYLSFPRLAPDGHTVVTDGRDLKGRQGIYVIDVGTGQTSLVVPVDPVAKAGQPEWSPDGRAIRYQEVRDRDVVLLERELGTAQVKEIFRTTSAGTRWIRISPDGRLAGFIRERPESTSSAFMVAPVSGGAPRVLFEAAGAFSLNNGFWQWTPDSQGVIIENEKGGGSFENPELWHLPLTGPARKLDIDGRQWVEGVQVHPDGKQIAFAAQAGEPGAEIWALENFLPAATANKRTPRK